MHYGVLICEYEYSYEYDCIVLYHQCDECDVMKPNKCFIQKSVAPSAVTLAFTPLIAVFSP